jgi:hypothetical protein
MSTGSDYDSVQTWASVLGLSEVLALLASFHDERSHKPDMLLLLV